MSKYGVRIHVSDIRRYEGYERASWTAGTKTPAFALSPQRCRIIPSIVRHVWKYRRIKNFEL